MEKVVLEDLTIPLGEEIAIPALVLPSRRIVLIETPILPSAARELAAWIPDNADGCQLALRELALGRPDDARVILNSARQAAGASPARIALIEAQIAMYSGQFAEAVTRYGEAATLAPDDPLLLCQLAVAQMQSGGFAQAEPILNQADNLCRQKPEETPWPPPSAATCTPSPG